MKKTWTLVLCAFLAMPLLAAPQRTAAPPLTLSVPAATKLEVLVHLQRDGTPIGQWLVDRILATEGYCGDDGAFRWSWRLHQDVLVHLSASAATDDDYPGAREERERVVRELKGVEFCPAG